MLSHQTPQLESASERSPFTPADESYLQEVLTECRVRLESALNTAQGYSRLPNLAIALSDAVTTCNEAIAVVNNPGINL